MEEIVKELKQIIKFKETTREGDVVLVAVENPRSVFYAVVTGITRDDQKRDEWWHLKLAVLSVPPQEVVWTLREPQFTGREIFTMADDGRFIQALDLSVQPLPEAPPQKPAKKEPKPKGPKRTTLRVVK